MSTTLSMEEREKKSEISKMIFQCSRKLWKKDCGYETHSQSTMTVYHDVFGTDSEIANRYIFRFCKNDAYLKKQGEIEEAFKECKLEIIDIKEQEINTGKVKTCVFYLCEVKP